MFTCDELKHDLPDLLDSPTVPVDCAAYGQDAFQIPGAEESLLLCRGSKAFFAGAIHFWMSAMRSQDWSYRQSYLLPYAQSAMCIPLSESEFLGFVSRCLSTLKQPLAWPPEKVGGFISALLMYDDWDDKAAVAEYSLQYVALFWDMTA